MTTQHQTMTVSISNQTVPFYFGDSRESINSLILQAKPTDWCFVTNEHTSSSTCVIASVPDEFSTNDLHSLIRYGIQFSRQHSPTHVAKTLRFSKVGVV